MCGLTAFSLGVLVLCAIAQNSKWDSDLMWRATSEVGGYALYGFLLSSCVLFTLSIVLIRRLSRLRLALGLFVFPALTTLLLCSPTL